MTKLITILVLALPALAQSSLKDSIAKHWKTSEEFTLAVAKSMPAENYNFRATPEEMSFGHLFAHIASANFGACANASGMTRPAAPAKMTPLLKDEKSDVDRDDAIQFLTDSFAFCNRAIESLTPEKLEAVAGPANRKMTGFEWLWAYFTHTAHHRGQAEVYLRLKGIKPPSYQF